MTTGSLLEQKVAVVSGLGPGLGRSIALGLAAQGADVVLAARRDKAMTKVATEVESMGRQALCVPTDITDAAACAALADAAAERFGRVDVCVNNAFHDGTFTTFAESNLDDWRPTFEVNFWGSLQLTKALLPYLEASGDGRVVMINTMSVDRIEPGFAAYAASKGALATVTKSLARELGPKGVRVNGVHPGFIFSPKVEWYLNNLAETQGRTYDEVYADLAGETCLGYLPDADQIAGAVVFFASPLATAVTGQSLGVNAGHWLS
jgi:NAD(P)-dependent dehydrogenase (short-subunit alcohol dehydrogenase family)